MKDEQHTEHMRHTLAHLLAASVLELHPNTKTTIGPAIDNGFYYDFEFENPISDKDLKSIEKKMRKGLSKWTEFTHEEVTADKAKEFFAGNPYKLELIDEIVEKGEKITLYTSGGFTDLCRGGHLENPAEEIEAKSFKLDKLAGAYWRGDEKNTMLTRIYGLAFETPEKLTEYTEMREEAIKRDHRKLGQELDLFTFSPLVGAGLPLFTPKGTALRDAIVERITKIQSRYGFQKVTIPHITKPDLYKKSGHWDKFEDDLFHVKSRESEFVLKPMNCPHHTQIFASQMRTYKDLPLRYVESTMVYRDEQSGELHGLSRVRSITQDDGHIFCTKEQMKEEIAGVVSIINEFYTSLGMLNEGSYKVSLSIRDPKTPEKYLGNDAVWDASEKVLEEVANEMELPYTRIEGEAAFYGPKLDFQFKDSLGREWQLGTAQLDLNMPTNFGLEYVDSDGSKQTPVMIHRAIAGSLERFMSMVIPHFSGAFPLWMAPVQVAIISISEEHKEYARDIKNKLFDEGLRVELDDSDNGLGKKIRYVKTQKYPYFLVIGDAEVANKTVTLESRDAGKIGEMSIEDLIAKLKEESK
jgi:threonyl-tRNA synthetase